MLIKREFVIAGSGVIWFGVGLLLLRKGIALLLYPVAIDAAPLLSSIQYVTGSLEQASLLAISMGLLFGFIKGRFVLTKTAHRVMKRLYAQPNPIPLRHAYPLSYLGLLAGMVALGGVLSLGIIPFDVRGVVDVAIGAALANASALYFRQLTPKGKKNYL